MCGRCAVDRGGGQHNGKKGPENPWHAWVLAIAGMRMATRPQYSREIIGLSSSARTNGISRRFVAQMLAQQDAKPVQRLHAHHLEGMP
jgi:hypothetical protein